MENIRISAEQTIGDLETLRLLADPLRLRLLAAVREEARSAKEIAGQLGMPVGKLYYHLDLLERHALIVVAATRIVSGIAEKQYRAAARAFRVDRSLLALDDATTAIDGMLAAVLDGTRVEAERSARSGAFADGASAILTRKVVHLTAERAHRLKGEIETLLEHIEHAESAYGDASAHNLTVAYFPLAEQH